VAADGRRRKGKTKASLARRRGFRESLMQSFRLEQVLSIRASCKPAKCWRGGEKREEAGANVPSMGWTPAQLPQQKGVLKEERMDCTAARCACAVRRPAEYTMSLNSEEGTLGAEATKEASNWSRVLQVSTRAMSYCLGDYWWFLMFTYQFVSYVPVRVLCL